MSRWDMDVDMFSETDQESPNVDIPLTSAQPATPKTNPGATSWKKGSQQNPHQQDPPLPIGSELFGTQNTKTLNHKPNSKQFSALSLSFPRRQSSVLPPLSRPSSSVSFLNKRQPLAKLNEQYEDELCSAIQNHNLDWVEECNDLKDDYNKLKLENAAVLNDVNKLRAELESAKDLISQQEALIKSLINICENTTTVLTGGPLPSANPAPPPTMVGGYVVANGPLPLSGNLFNPNGPSNYNGYTNTIIGSTLPMNPNNPTSSYNLMHNNLAMNSHRNVLMNGNPNGHPNGHHQLIPSVVAHMFRPGTQDLSYPVPSLPPQNNHNGPRNGNHTQPNRWNGNVNNARPIPGVPTYTHNGHHHTKTNQRQMQPTSANNTASRAASIAMNFPYRRPTYSQHGLWTPPQRTVSGGGTAKKSHSK